MPVFDRTLPPLLARLHRLPFDYDEGNGIDFEPYDRFQSARETTSWFRSWTGNEEVDGHEFRVFGQDGTGGSAAFWLERAGKLLPSQPIVFLGSEGEVGVVACNLADYLWLLAGGVGPCEAVVTGVGRRKKNAVFTEFAAGNAPDAKKPPSKVLSAARKEFPDFKKRIRALCR